MLCALSIECKRCTVPRSGLVQWILSIVPRRRARMAGWGRKPRNLRVQPITRARPMKRRRWRFPPRCKGRSKFRPLRRHRMRASSTDSSKGQKVLNARLVWDFSGTRSGPVTAAVAGFSSATWPEFGPPYTTGNVCIPASVTERPPRHGWSWKGALDSLRNAPISSLHSQGGSPRVSACSGIIKIGQEPLVETQHTFGETDAQ